MTVLIAEDENLAAEHLTEMILRCDPSATILAQVDSVADVIRFLQSGNSIDLMFLDIQLADGKSFEIFDAVVTDVPAIFTTAYDQYALKAFKHHSIDYLLKPIQEEELKRAIHKFKRLKMRSSLSGENLKALRELIEQKPSYKQRIVVKTGNKLQFKPVEEVAYFFADGKEAYLVTLNDNRKYLISYTLEELEQLLDPVDFFRISRKYILRVDAIAEVKGTVASQFEVRLIQPAGLAITVSRERVSTFKKWLDR